MKKTLLTSLMVLPLILFSQTLDQSQTDNSSSLDIFFGDPSEFIYQSFTAGISGDLTSIELSFEASEQDDLTVEIYSGSFEDDDLSLLGGSVVALTGAGGLVSASFDGLELVSGNKYSIKIYSGTSFQFVQGTFDDVYEGVHTDVYGTTENTGDIYFKTFVEESPVTGTSQTLGQKVELSVYPNPALGGSVQFSSTLNYIEVYNAKGEVVLTASATSTIDVSSLDSGLYSVKTEQGSAKLMIQ